MVAREGSHHPIPQNCSLRGLNPCIMMGISRKARGYEKGNRIMLLIDKLPARLNGYDIVAALPKIMPDGSPSDRDLIILGHDATRRNSKYVTAYVHIPPAGQSIREWYWGNYSEELEVGLRSLINRASINLELQITGGEATI